jgi:hypothetical protein
MEGQESWLAERRTEQEQIDEAYAEEQSLPQLYVAVEVRTVERELQETKGENAKAPVKCGSAVNQAPVKCRPVLNHT